MPNMTFAIPEKLHKFIKVHREVNWSEIGRRALWDYAYKIQRMEKREAEREASKKDTEDNKGPGQQNLL
jgi:Arc/MetJ-type ribon-helix-helix transcriptional regulator